MRNKFFLSLCGLLLSLGVFAQKMGDVPLSENPYNGDFARQYFWLHQLKDATDTVTIKQILARELKLGSKDQLYVLHIATSLAATHITFGQFYNGLPVLGGVAKVSVNRKNVMYVCTENLFGTYDGMGDLPSNFKEKTGLQNFTEIEFLEDKPAYIFNGTRLIAGWYARFTSGTDGYYEAAWASNGDLIFVKDLINYYQAAGPDSLVTALVFDPDPITPISQNYGGIYVDNNDQNLNVLNPLRITRNMRVDFSNGIFSLKSPYVEIAEFSAPTNIVVTSTTPNFSYNRSEIGFEQVNTYFHINEFQNYLQSLGYTLVNYPIRVDAQGFGGQDNSSFNSAFNPPRLTFGIGGVDDGEDADVIIHEYGHAIAYSASPNTNSGTQRSSLDEALGDYLAVSYKKQILPFGADKVFNWDGHNTYWAGRTVNNPTNFNYKNINFNDIYKYTTLWNDAMFDIWGQLGKTYTDKLQLEAVHGYSNNMTFTQAANLVLAADVAMSSGANQQVIRAAFVQRGILDPMGITENNTSKDAFLVKNAVLTNQEIQIEAVLSGTATIYNISGVAVATANFGNGITTLAIAKWPAGLYLVQIQIANSQPFTQKLVIVSQ